MVPGFNSEVSRQVRRGIGRYSDEYFSGSYRYVLYGSNGPEYIYQDKRFEYKNTGFWFYVVVTSLGCFLALAVILVPLIVSCFVDPNVARGGAVFFLFIFFPWIIGFYMLVLSPLRRHKRMMRSVEIDPFKEYEEVTCESCEKVYLSGVHSVCPNCGVEIPKKHARVSS